MENGLPQGIPRISHSTSPSLDELSWSGALNENNNETNSEHQFTVGCIDSAKLKEGVCSSLAWFSKENNSKQNLLAIGWTLLPV